ncbi:MAG: PLP-dependent aminotransferase family protein [Thermodesulfobacteriota bacterium]
MGVILKIDENDRRPVYRQIMDQVIDLVEGGVLKPGDRLPSSRLLAIQLGVNRSTVYRAYQELWSLGYLRSRPGSYSTIRKRVALVSPGRKSSPGLIPWSIRVNPEAEVLYRSFEEEEEFTRKAAAGRVFNFIPLAPDPRLLPVKAFRKAMTKALAAAGDELLQYGSPRGYEPLREFIAARLGQHGVSLSPPEIMITTGAQQALDLLVRMLAGPGSPVVVEAPTYARALDLFRLNRLEIIAVQMKADGLDLEALEDRVSRARPVLLYTIPNFHNPTGITTDQVHRERLLDLCLRRRIPLVEDGFEEEMKYGGKAVRPIKSMDRRGVVIYVGTFSKVAFPGLRLGWIAADKECIDRLVPIQRASILSGNLVDQAAFHRFCLSGGYDLHLKRMHGVYRKRMQAALKALQTFMPPDRVEWTRPIGGYIIWLRLNNLALGEEELVNHLLDHGVAVLPGSCHFHGPPGGLFFRLSIASLDEAALEAGIKRLGQGLSRLYGT